MTATEQCSFPGCTKPVKSNGLCNSHNEQRRAGKELTPLRGYAKQDPTLAEAGLRTCNTCGETKDIEEFYTGEWLCKACSKTRTVQYKRDHPEYNREQIKLYRQRYPEKVKQLRAAEGKRNINTRRTWRLKAVYNLTPEQFDAMLAAQGGCCAICRAAEPGGRRVGTWCVDHDHETGAVRGLLCARCNRALGLFGDNVEVLRSAIAYLKRHMERSSSQ
jgi:hypothetical protein